MGIHTPNALHCLSTLHYPIFIMNKKDFEELKRIFNKKELEILELAKQGFSLTKIAKQRGITKQWVSLVLQKFKRAGYYSRQPKKTRESLILEEGKLSIKEISKITGLAQGGIQKLIFTGDFPKHTDEINNPLDSSAPIHCWDEDTVMNWCKERIEVIKQELLKRLSKNKDYLQFNSLSAPFEDMRWKGNLRKFKSHKERYKPKNINREYYQRKEKN